MLSENAALLANHGSDSETLGATYAIRNLSAAALGPPVTNSKAKAMNMRARSIMSAIPYTADTTEETFTL
jgi:hypothetical protein